MELDRPSPSTEPLPKSSLPLKAVQEEPSGVTEAHHLAAVAQPIPAASNPETNKNGASEGIVGSAEANAAATLGLLTSVANSVNQQQQQQQQQQAQQQQPSFTPINQPQASPGGSPGPQLGPCPTTPNPLPPGYNKDQPICANCSTQTTPLWRRSHDSTHILCNACALFFKMKGRPRPISLKTDVIKSRNRSKGKSTSKDRAGPGAGPGPVVGGPVKAVSKNDRGESHSRPRESDVVGRKSAPGGADDDDDEMGRSRSFGDGALDGDSAGRKARKTGPAYGVPIGYGGGVPGAYPYPYGYPHPAHPHAHAPYPPSAARARSRSSDPSARGVSGDRRRGADGAATPPTGGPGGPSTGAPGGYGYPPVGYHPGAPGAHPEGAAAAYPSPYPGYPYYGGPGGYGAHPGQPGYYPSPAGHYTPGHPHPSLAHLHAPTAAHAQSDSRSRSPGAANATPKSGRSSASASPPHPSTHPTSATGSPAVQPHWSHPTANLHLHHVPHTHSPLGGARPPISVPTSMSRGSSAAPPLSSERGVTLAPIAAPATDAAGSNGAAPVSTSRPHLPSIGSVGTVRTESPAGGTIPRHTSLFEPRYQPDSAPSSHVNTPADTPPSLTAPDAAGRPRGVSVSSNSPSVSGSSEGVRSPEVSHRQPTMPWGKTPGTWTPDDERRGRPERRFDDAPILKGKGREIDEIDELDEDVDVLKPSLTASHPSASRVRGEDHRRMVGVETGLNELRMADHHHTNHPHFSPSSVPPSASSGLDESSRSRSGARERGRSRGPGMAGHRSQSTSRARGMSTHTNGSGPGPRSTSSGRRTLAELEAENARLRTKNAELTFLNGLMQSRLGQLEGPGRVPTAPMTGLSGAEDEEPYPDSASAEDDVAMDQQEESVTPVSVHHTAAAEESAELAKLTEDPQLRSRLLDFLRAQGNGVGR